ncbi:MAG: hypothetical protein WC889_05660 [Myxococcota bacterium]|jgi:hypothetical protein
MSYRVTDFGIALALIALCVGPAAAWGNSKTIVKTALSGQKIEVYDGASVNPDCSNAGTANFKAVSGPSHGTISIINAKTFPHFSKNNIRWKCNFVKVEGIKVLYRSVPGFKGKDHVVLSIHTYDGRSYNPTIDVTVE